MPYTQAIDAKFFAQYDELKASIALGGDEQVEAAEAASKAALRALYDQKVTIDMAQARLKETEQTLAKLRQPFMVLKPDTWFTCNGGRGEDHFEKQRVKRVEEVAAAKEKEAALATKKKEAVLTARKATQAASRVEQDMQLVAEMFNAVVDQFPTPTLTELLTAAKTARSGSTVTDSESGEATVQGQLPAGMAGKLAAEKQRAFQLARKKICGGMEILIDASAPF